MFLTSKLQAIKNVKEELNQLQHQKNELVAEINELQNVSNGYGKLEEIGYERYAPIAIGDDVEKQICQAEVKLAEMAANKQIIIYSREYRVDGSTSKGRKFQENYGKNLLIGFNAYTHNKAKSMTAYNYYRNCDLIKKAFDKYNKQGELLGIKLNEDYLNIGLHELELIMQFRIRHDEEKSRLKEERRRMKEQEKLLEDIAKEEAYIERERKAMDVAFAKALTDEERERIKAQLSELDKRQDDLVFRKSHEKAGWVYVISSPSLPNMVKVGATRRLNPTIRVKELSSSSLPFPFKTHGFIFSDNCFELESRMHCYFDDKRVAEDREFFYITPKEAIDVLKNKFNQEVHFESEDDEE